MAESGNSLDVITIGRSSVDLYGQQVGGRLEDMHSFAKYVGGCPTNIAIGTSRLGLRSGVITGVGRDHMGRFIMEELARNGVSLDGVKVDDERLTALVLLGIRDPDTFPLIFYRENCPDMALREDDIDEGLIASARSVLLTGTHLSNSGVKAASLKAMRLAKKSGAKVILDIDYRPVLWGLTSPELGEERFVADPAVSSELQSVVEGCDLIVGTEEEFHIAGGTTDTLSALRRIRDLTDAVLVCKRGSLGCVAFDADVGETWSSGVAGKGFAVEVFNVLGAGDAFMSGFLAGWLRCEPLTTCCDYANACGAIVVSRHGCAPASPTWEELQHFLANGSPYSALRQDDVLEQMHWSGVRANVYGDLAVLAVDHRSQLEALAAETGAEAGKIAEFKQIALEALDEFADTDVSLGILVDGRHGMRTLEATGDRTYWVGRPIEVPGSCPVEFDTSRDIGSELVTWPKNHVVKCLCFYHVDDPPELRAVQDSRVSDLFSACRTTDHEFLLEIICSNKNRDGRGVTAKVMRHFYGIGVFPDWWKLESQPSEKDWQEIAAVIEEHDSTCRGILVLGLAAPEDELVEGLKTAARIPSVKGFAIGRTIFYETARDFFKRLIDKDMARRELHDRFHRFVSAWQLARHQ